MDSPRNWQIFITADGSPTLNWSRPDGYAEKMHHSGGALTESLFIYQSALREVLTRGWPVHVLSLGLGLGYNELITIAEMRRAAKGDWAMSSFEAEESLRESFARWVEGETVELGEVHADVLARTALAHGITPAELLDDTRLALRTGRLRLLGRFPESALDLKGCTCVFYDAYSKKMDADLWDEDKLVERFASLLARECVLSTYAATGSMKRALHKLGFRLLPRPGFLGKRESTLAIREG